MWILRNKPFSLIVGREQLSRLFQEMGPNARALSVAQILERGSIRRRARSQDKLIARITVRDEL